MVKQDLVTEARASTDVADHGKLAGMTLRQIEQQITALPEQLSGDELLRWLDLTAELLSRAKEMRAAVEQIAVRWIDSNGPIEISVDSAMFWI